MRYTSTFVPFAVPAATVTDYQNGNGVHLTLTAPPESLDFLQSQGRALIRRALGKVKQTGQVDVRLASTFDQ